MLERFIKAYRFIDEHGTFTDNPATRLGQLLLKSLRDPTLPIVVLGGLVSELFKTLANNGAPTGLLYQNGDPTVLGYFVIAEVGALVLYAVGDEVAEALEAAKEAYEDEEATS